MRPAPLQLDFRQGAQGVWRWIGFAMLLVAVALAMLLAQRQTAIAERLADVQGRHELLSLRVRAGESRPATAAVDAQTLADIRRANAIIDQLTVPWDALFDALEAADARGLGLLSLTPVARDRTLRISGEARNLTDLLAYVDRVAAQPTLGQVYLIGHSTAVRDGATVVLFTMAATWRAQP